MKILAKSKQYTDENFIHITVYIDDISSVAASTNVSKDDLKHLIEFVRYRLIDAGFIILNEYNSDDEAYYFKFYAPYFEDKQNYIILVDFRIANHTRDDDNIDMKSIKYIDRLINNKDLFSRYYLNGNDIYVINIWADGSDGHTISDAEMQIKQEIDELKNTIIEEHTETVDTIKDRISKIVNTYFVSYSADIYDNYEQGMLKLKYIFDSTLDDAQINSITSYLNIYIKRFDKNGICKYIEDLNSIVIMLNNYRAK